MIYRLEYKDICVLNQPTAQKLQNLTWWSDLSLKNCRISRAGRFHRSGNAKFHAWESSIARELRNLTCEKVPPLGNREILRAGVVHRSGNAKSHAQEQSIAQESQNPTRRSVPSPRNRRISRAVEVHRSGNAKSHARQIEYQNLYNAKIILKNQNRKLLQVRCIHSQKFYKKYVKIRLLEISKGYTEGV